MRLLYFLLFSCVSVNIFPETSLLRGVPPTLDMLIDDMASSDRNTMVEVLMALQNLVNQGCDTEIAIAYARICVCFPYKEVQREAMALLEICKQKKV